MASSKPRDALLWPGAFVLLDIFSRLEDTNSPPGSVMESGSGVRRFLPGPAILATLCGQTLWQGSSGLKRGKKEHGRRSRWKRPNSIRIHSLPQGQCPYMTFTVVFMGSPMQHSVRKPTSSQLLQCLLPKAWAFQSSQHTTGDLQYVACIKNLESKCHAHGSHYSNTGPEESLVLTTPGDTGEGKDTRRPGSAKLSLQSQLGEPVTQLGATAISVKQCPV